MKTLTLHIFLIALVISGKVFSQSQKQIEQLKKIIQTTENDTLKVTAYFEWDELIYLSDQDLDEKLNQKVIDICELKLKRNDLSKRDRFFYERSLSRALNNKGLVLIEKNKTLEALDCLNRSYRIAKKQKNIELEAFTINNMGTIYRSAKDFKKAITYYQKSFAVTHDSLGNPETFNNIGLCYSDLSDFKNAMKYYNLSLKYSTGENHELNAANTLLNIADIYEITKDYDQALKYYQLALQSNSKIDNNYGKSFSYCKIGNILRIQKKYKEAIEHVEKGMQLAQKFDLLFNKKECALGLYKIYKDFKNSDLALYYYEKHILYKSEFLEQTNDNELIRKQYYYEYKNKEELEKTKHKKEMELIAEKSKRQKLLLIFFGVGLFVIGIFSIFIFRSYRKTRKMNAIIESQKQIVETKNQEILDSISYAKRLQDAVLPNEQEWFTSFKNSFIYYLPKDIVAGDFYWMRKMDQSIIFAVADCTGHGVPGAMVSLVCSNALHRVVEKINAEANPKFIPGEILDQVRAQVIESFSSKHIKETHVNDGMDISLGVISKKENGKLSLSWAGANNALMLVKGINDDQELIQYRGDNQPVGNFWKSTKFTSHEIDISHNDVLYMFTDGFADQFGGKQEGKLGGKKYKSKRMRELILDLQILPIADQKSKFDEEFTSWKGTLEQVDDVCVVGIKLDEINL